MRKITMFILRSCPFCIRAMQQVEKILSANPEFRAIPFETIDERQQQAYADKHDYYYVPSIYLDGEKVYEERVLHRDLLDIFKKAMEEK